jgi:hypothetical protein
MPQQWRDSTAIWTKLISSSILRLFAKLGEQTMAERMGSQFDLKNGLIPYIR